MREPASMLETPCDVLSSMVGEMTRVPSLVEVQQCSSIALSDDAPRDPGSSALRHNEMSSWESPEVLCRRLKSLSTVLLWKVSLKSM